MKENTVEIWKSEYRPEIGNMALIADISNDDYYGIVVDVPIGPSLVEIAWWPKKKKSRRARLENKGHQAVSRVVHGDRMSVVNYNYRKQEDREASDIINKILSEAKEQDNV